MNDTAKAPSLWFTILTCALLTDASVKPLGHPVLFHEDIWVAPKQILRDETRYFYNVASEDPGTGSGSVKAKTRPQLMEL